MFDLCSLIVLTFSIAAYPVCYWSKIDLYLEQTLSVTKVPTRLSVQLTLTFATSNIENNMKIIIYGQRWSGCGVWIQIPEEELFSLYRYENDTQVIHFIRAVYHFSVQCIKTKPT